MPRQRKNGQNRKNETRIRTRLLELSMKIENFIYHKALITESEAEMCIKEVSSYKMECLKDKSSLQVIEKLTRCMKAIIAEHQERRINNSTNDDVENVRTNTASPVYSLPDEDRTQFTQQERPVTSSINNVINNEDYNRADFYQVNEHYVAEYKVIDNIDICDVEDDDCSNEVNKNTEVSDINVDGVMNKALSNLSINDIVDQQMCTEDCSQSILNNFEDTAAAHSGLPKNTKVTSLAPVINDSIKIIKPIILNKNARFGKFNANNPLVLKVSKAITNTFNSNKQIPNEIISINNNNTFDKRMTNIAEQEQVNLSTRKAPNYVQQNSTYITTNTYLTNNADPSIVDNKISKITNTMQHLAETKNNTSINTDKEKNPVLVKRKRAPRKKKEIHVKDDDKVIEKIDSAMKHLNCEINKKNLKTGPKKTYNRNKNVDKKKDSAMSIYNKNVENDLSWLEGIRYVREIGKDEFDSKTTDLNENFWDNFDLPPNFDDSDFL